MSKTKKLTDTEKCDAIAKLLMKAVEIMKECEQTKKDSVKLMAYAWDKVTEEEK